MHTTPKLEQVAQEYGPMVRRIASTYEADPHRAEELVQEILFSLWRALPTFRGEAPLRAFVARVATNRAVSHVKRAVRTGRSVELSDDLPAPEEGPEAAAIILDRQSKLLGAVRALPLAYRQAAMLTLEGFTCAEVADMLGISANAVAIRISRARELLRARMEGAR